MIGCDIDPYAFEAIRERFPNAPVRNFLLADFLTSKPNDFPFNEVDVVVGNPPYIRHHHLTIDQKSASHLIRKGVNPYISGQASAWCLFLLHSMEFLRPNGRAAWILPTGLIYTTYGKALITHLKSRFKNTNIEQLEGRFFLQEGTNEKTVLLLADGFIKNGVCGENSLAAPNSSPECRATKALFNQSTLNRGTSDRSTEHPLLKQVVPLGSLCDIRIGLVTGDSRFLLLNETTAKQWGIEWDDLMPVIGRAKDAPGIIIDSHEVHAKFKSGHKVGMIDTRISSSSSVIRYIASKDKNSIAANATFKKRKLWHQPFDLVRPDAYFAGMSHRFPRLIIARDGIPCTNTLYRIKFMSDVSECAKRLACLSLISSFGQLSSEAEGRPYSSGLLKHEPSDVARIKVFTCSKPSYEEMEAFSAVDLLLKSGASAQATDEADRFLTEARFITQEELKTIKIELEWSRSQRRST